MSGSKNENDLTRLVNLLAGYGYDVVHASSQIGELTVKVYPPQSETGTSK